MHVMLLNLETQSGTFQNNKCTENFALMLYCYLPVISPCKASHCMSVRRLPLQSKNKVSLRNLSMVLRQLPAADGDAHGKQVLESVDMARQAVQLDVTDGTSWCE